MYNMTPLTFTIVVLSLVSAALIAVMLVGIIKKKKMIVEVQLSSH